MRGTPITPEEIQRALQLHETGMQWREIGKLLNRSHSYLYKLAVHGEQTRLDAAKRARDNRNRWVYGLTDEDYAALVITQNGTCALCPKNLAETKACVDHDHDTGRVRGILCHQCNIGIGILMENPALLRKAADYIEGKLNE